MVLHPVVVDGGVVITIRVEVGLTSDDMKRSVARLTILRAAHDGTDRLRGIDLYHRWASITDEWRRGNHSGAGE